MAYSTSNPPSLISQGIGNNAPAIWQYQSGDSLATIHAAGYITNATDLGMKVGDWVMVYTTIAGQPLAGYKVLSFTGKAANLSTTDTTIGTGS